MLIVTAISILTIPNTLTVLLEYISLFNLNHNGNIKKNLGGAAYPWPHTTLYLNLTNQLSVYFA